MEYKGGISVDENVKNKLTKMLSGINKGKMSKISELLGSEDGKRLVSSLSEAEKQAIIQKFLSMDTEEIDKKLKNFDKDSIRNITAEDIKKKLR